MLYGWRMPHRRLFHFFSPSTFYPRPWFHLFRLFSTSSSTISAFLYPPFFFVLFHPLSILFLSFYPSWNTRAITCTANEFRAISKLGGWRIFAPYGSAWTKINTIIPSVYDIVQFSWIILFSKFQRNLFQRGVSFSCVSFFYGFCSYFIKRTNFFLKKKKKEKETRNTEYEYFVSLRSGFWKAASSILNLNRVRGEW